MINIVTLILFWAHEMRDSVAEDTARTSRGSPMYCFAAIIYVGLRDTSVLSRTLSEAGGAGALLPAGTGARGTTGAKLFLKRTREDAAGVPAVDSVGVPVGTLQNQWALLYQGKSALRSLITVQSLRQGQRERFNSERLTDWFTEPIIKVQ